MSPLTGTVEATVPTLVNVFKNGCGAAADAGNVVPRMTAPADSAINVREVRVMTTSETHQRAPAGYPLPLKTETSREKFTSSTLMSKAGHPWPDLALGRWFTSVHR
jgi:hypothetical protein